MIKFYLDGELFVNEYLRGDGVVASDRKRLEPTNLPIYENVIHYQEVNNHLIIVRLNSPMEKIEPNKTYSLGIRLEKQGNETHIILDEALNDPENTYGFIFYAGRKAFKVLEKEASFEKQWTGKTWDDEMYFVKIGLYRKAKIKYYLPKKKFKFLEFNGEWKEYKADEILSNTQAMLNMYSDAIVNID